MTNDSLIGKTRIIGRRFVRGLRVLWWLASIPLVVGALYFLPGWCVIAMCSASLFGFLLFGIYKTGEAEERLERIRHDF